MHAVLVTDLSSCIVVTENGGNKQLTGMGVILSTVHAGVMALPLHLVCIFSLFNSEFLFKCYYLW